jgi:hypothetical protein
MPIIDIKASDECRCGVPGSAPCPPGSVFGTWIKGWMLTSKNVFDSKTTRCIAEAKRIQALLVPEKVIYGGLPEKYTKLEEQWHDPETRSKLIAFMASRNIHGLRQLIPTGMMTEPEFIRFWAVRLKGYLDLIHNVAHYDLIPSSPETEKLDSFFSQRF